MSPSSLYNTHVPNSLLPESCPSQQQNHSVSPKAHYQWGQMRGCSLIPVPDNESGLNSK